jgi:phytoene dehydrogenase-like protein
MSDAETSISRRDLLRRIGQTAGAAMMYRSMSALGFAGESNYTGPIDLSGAPHDTSVLVLGAGMAGLVAAYELSRAGYKVKVLEYNQRAGGRSWTLRGGDDYTELGGFKQHCQFDPGLYINPGPWRIPYHHNAMLDYAKRFKVPLEPFNEINYNAYLHSSTAFGGKPQRYRPCIPFPRHPSYQQGRAQGQLDADSAPRTGQAARSLAQLGLPRQRPPVPEVRVRQPEPRLRGRPRWRTGSAPGAIGTAALRRAAALRVVGLPFQSVRLRTRSFAVPAGRWHGSHRESDPP